MRDPAGAILCFLVFLAALGYWYWVRRLVARCEAGDGSARDEQIYSVIKPMNLDRFVILAPIFAGLLFLLSLFF